MLRIDAAGRWSSSPNFAASEAKHGDVAVLGADRLLPSDPGDLEAALADENITIITDVVGGAIRPTLIDVLERDSRYTCSGTIAGPMVDFVLRNFYLRDPPLPDRR